MDESGFGFRVAFDSAPAAQAVADHVKQQGGQADVEEEKGILPLGILLVIFIPPGLALLAEVVNNVVHSWRDHGVVIDARGTGDPVIHEEKSLPFGTIVILTRDGDTAKRTDLPEVDVGKYIAAALKAVGGGASASAAKTAADTLLAA